MQYETAFSPTSAQEDVDDLIFADCDYHVSDR